MSGYDRPLASDSLGYDEWLFAGAERDAQRLDVEPDDEGTDVCLSCDGAFRAVEYEALCPACSDAHAEQAAVDAADQEEL